MEAKTTPTKHCYEYEPLPDGLFARYLYLHPANTDTDPLICTMFTAHLDEIPDFEAISYVWGIAFKIHTISCDGKTIPITFNLRDALSQVRLKNKPRTLWVDSICINQADPQEQSHQVSLMGGIYKKSTRTLICLRSSDHVHASIVANLVIDIGYMIESVFKKANFCWGANSFPFPDEEDLLLFHRGWKSFGVLLQQPWFKRGWVVQEAALNEDTLLLWADASIKWLELLRTYTWYVRRALELPNIQQLWLSDLHLQGFYLHRYDEAITFRGDSDVGPYSFLEILNHARWLDVTDHRDRIYAFLGLPKSDKLRPILQPNYELTYSHVYQSFACEYLKVSKDLDILHFNTLQVRAVIIDTVKLAAMGYDKNSTTPKDITLLWKSISTSSIIPPYPCTPLLVFVDIFRCGIYRGRLKEWRTLESAYIRFLQQELLQGDALYEDAKLFHEKRMEDVHNKSFVVTARGYYGLAPDIVEVDDVCCIIFGTRSPFILRRLNRAGCYKLVGSVLLLSEKLDHNGRPGALGRDEDCQEWTEWGLEEEDISLC
ncbi:heterokaryon incompatibility protein-domain-containing protein [Truncatella angustata]|uniref:Heterokaryon incompatibility protein-domain-containing protein n=1 Tax=Truncatella angustata TaxID=152316 RepID=A0A9P8UUC0_9PEZI|nr:heterokaryon incompatibility protein-domain-containing protein [Truncatella angustata]KAH6658155.1 heterokaryon incompatibility protein-domain-containing protein [Truncatella angustata]